MLQTKKTKTLKMDAVMNQNPYYAGLPLHIWYSIHLCAMFVILCSCIGSTYIIILSIVEASKRKLRTIQKFPLCISICDLIFGITISLTINMSFFLKIVVEK